MTFYSCFVLEQTTTKIVLNLNTVTLQNHILQNSYKSERTFKVLSWQLLPFLDHLCEKLKKRTFYNEFNNI